MNATNLIFRKATRSASKARIALIGPAGSGKTMTALLIARGLVGPNGRIAVIDSERGSASLYAGTVTDFDHLDLPDHNPNTYMNALWAAADAGYDAVIIDSLSHAWMGKDGALEMVDEATRRSRATNGTANGFASWREVTPVHNRLVDQIIGAPFHVLSTMRSKTEWVMEVVNGKNVPRKVGLSPVQRDGVEYEFDFVADLDTEHAMLVTKTRFAGVTVDGRPLGDRPIDRPGVPLGTAIAQWIAGGTGDVIASRSVRPGAAPAVGVDRSGADGRQQDQQPHQSAQQQAPAQPSPAERINKAVGAWAQLPNRPAWAEAMFTELVNHAQGAPTPEAVTAIAAFYGGVRGGHAPDAIMRQPPLRSYLNKAGWAVKSPAADERAWIAALIAHARPDAAAEDLAARVPDAKLSAVIGELQSLSLEERPTWLGTVMSVGWPFEEVERPKQGESVILGPDGQPIPF